MVGRVGKCPMKMDMRKSLGQNDFHIALLIYNYIQRIWELQCHPGTQRPSTFFRVLYNLANCFLQAVGSQH